MVDGAFDWGTWKKKRLRFLESLNALRDRPPPIVHKSSLYLHTMFRLQRMTSCCSTKSIPENKKNKVLAGKVTVRTATTLVARPIKRRYRLNEQVHLRLMLYDY